MRHQTCSGSCGCDCQDCEDARYRNSREELADLEYPMKRRNCGDTR